MLWSHTGEKPDLSIGVHSLDSGGMLYRGAYHDGEVVINTVLSGRSLVIDGMKKMLAAYQAGQPIYARITSGARAGSITRIVSSRFALKGFTGLSSTYSERIIQTGTVKDRPDIWACFSEDQYRSFGHRKQLRMGMVKWLDLPYTEYEMFEFDGRKTVKANYSDWESLEFLPDHAGSTEFVFTRAAQMTAAQKQAAAQSANYCHTPIDMFGKEIALGDMIIYARAGELVIGRLTKVTDSGYMVVETILDKRELRLQGSESSDCIVNRKINPAVMKFERDEVLSQKLMMEKLKR